MRAFLFCLLQLTAFATLAQFTANNPSYVQQNKTVQREFKIASNLYVRIEGDLPTNYKPKWNHVNNVSHILNFYCENFGTHKNSWDPVGLFSYRFGLGGETADNRKAIIYISRSAALANIDIPGDKAVITSVPQTFRLINFHKENKQPMNSDENWTGSVTLSADRKGNITLKISIEVYEPAKNSSKWELAHRFSIASEILPNLSSPDYSHYVADVEIARKTSLANLLSKMNSYKSYGCDRCIERVTQVTASQYEVENEDLQGRSFKEKRTGNDAFTTYKNNCNKKVVLLAIQKYSMMKDGVPQMQYKDVSIFFNPHEEKYINDPYIIMPATAPLEYFLNPNYSDEDAQEWRAWYLRVACQPGN